MFDNTSGVLVVSEETPDRLCYFELDDLNVEQPIALVSNLISTQVIGSPHEVFTIFSWFLDKLLFILTLFGLF